MNVGIIGGTAALPSLGALTASMCAPYGGKQEKPVRYTYKDEEGDFTRAYSHDSLSNRHTFVELLQGTEYCYQESDIQKFLSYKDQKAIIVEEI